MNERDISKVTHIDGVKLREDGQAVVILDQSLLPAVTEYRDLQEPEEMHEAIRKLRVRGAPAIGICAAYCMYVLAARRGPCKEFAARIREDGEFLKSSRPTAVNLSWAVQRVIGAAMEALGAEAAGADAGVADTSGAGAAGADASLRDGSTPAAGSLQEEAILAMKREAVAIHEEDIEMCRAISRYGLSLVKPGDGILTHCNAGPLATSRYGTALGPILLGREQGVDLKVFADETRPLLQGARLTAYELEAAGVDVTLICDNMASAVMRNGWIQACFVGCDRVAANGDTANKIGTSGVAILAKHYGIPFYVLGPSSTVDLDCPTGADIPIELREPDEIKELFFEQPSSPESVRCYNPAFDVTDHELITAIVTEKGICRPPFTESLGKLK